MTDKCLVEKTRRDRVNGTGPKRNQLVTFQKLGEVSQELYDYLNTYLNKNSYSDIGSDDYAISRGCNYDQVFNVGTKYRQLLLQKNRTNNMNTMDEYVYSQWIPGTEIVQTELNKFFNKVYRTRMSEMHPDHTLNWHIDADTSVICRAQICLNENNSTFLFKDKEGIKEFKMKPRELWFINTGWKHMVTNDTTNIRRVVIIGFHYDDLKSELQEKIKIK